jgi:Ca2+-binding EF-hand superfamily protein
MILRCLIAATLISYAFAGNAFANADALAVADKNEDGRLTDAEARDGIKAVIAEANAADAGERGKRLLSALDANKDKKLDDQEATAGVVEARRGTAQGRRVDETLRGLDENKDNVVDKKEFEKLPDQLGIGGRWMRRRTGEMFADLDTDKNGKITVTEAHLNSGVLGPRFGGRGRGGDDDDGPATAAAPPTDALRNNIERQFTLLDRDKDQKLAEKEYKGNKELRVRAKQMDLDLDEELSVDEIYAFFKAHPEK